MHAHSWHLTRRSVVRGGQMDRGLVRSTSIQPTTHPSGNSRQRIDTVAAGAGMLRLRLPRGQPARSKKPRTGTRRSVTRLLARGQRAPRGRRERPRAEEEEHCTGRPLRETVLVVVVPTSGLRVRAGRAALAQVRSEEDPAICCRRLRVISLRPLAFTSAARRRRIHRQER